MEKEGSGWESARQSVSRQRSTVHHIKQYTVLLPVVWERRSDDARVWPTFGLRTIRQAVVLENAGVLVSAGRGRRAGSEAGQG